MRPKTHRPGRYSMADLTRHAPSTRSQVTHFIRAGLVHPDSLATGTGHYHVFRFRALIEATIAAQLSRAGMTVSGIKKALLGLHVLDPFHSPEIRATWERPDRNLNDPIERDITAALAPVEAFLIDEENRARAADGRAPLPPVEQWSVADFAAWVTAANALTARWDAFKDPTSRGDDRFFFIYVPADDRPPTLIFAPRQVESVGEAGTLVNLAKILERLEAATGDWWGDD